MFVDETKVIRILLVAIIVHCYVQVVGITARCLAAPESFMSASLRNLIIITQRNLLSVSDITVAVYKTKYVRDLNKAITAGWYISHQEQQSCTNAGLVALVARDHRARFSQ